MGSKKSEVVYKAKQTFLWYKVGDKIKEDPIPPNWIESGLIWDGKMEAAVEKAQEAKDEAVADSKGDGGERDPNPEEAPTEGEDAPPEESTPADKKPDWMDNFLGGNAGTVCKGVREDNFSLDVWNKLLDMERAGKKQERDHARVLQHQ